MTQQSTWYTNFFTELPNAFWRAAIPTEVTEAEVDFLVRATGLAPGGHVLDVPCGSGRHVLEFARRGYRVTGVDISAEAIDHARAAADETGLTVDLRVADMASLPADVRPDMAICMGNAFGYLEHDGNRRFLAETAASLRPGGSLVLDYGFVAESALRQFDLDEAPMTLGGVEATSVNSYDPVHSRWITEFTFRRGDEVHHGTSVQHVYTSAEVIRMVTEAGFTSVDLYGDVDWAPFGLDSHRLLLVAHLGD